MNNTKENKIDKFLNETFILEESFLNKIECKRYDVLNEVKNNEQKVNQLFERKGVAMYDFKTEIQEIVDYILKEFYESYRNVIWQYGSITFSDEKKYNCFFGNYISIQIPKPLTKKIEFIKNLDIYIKILPLKEIDVDEKTQLTASLESFSRIYKKNNLNLFKNKLKRGSITCGLISFNGVLKPETISLKLYHELGHYFQDFNLQKNKNSLYQQTARDSYYSNRNVFTTSKNPYIVKIGKIFYTLFNKTELSQHASSIYSELVEINPNISDINKAIQQTTTYNWYKTLLEYTNELDSYPSVDIWEASRMFYKTKSHPNGYENLSAYSFKEKFIKLAIKYLNIFYRKMMNAVELYIENKFV